MHLTRFLPAWLLLVCSIRMELIHNSVSVRPATHNKQPHQQTKQVPDATTLHTAKIGKNNDSIKHPHSVVVMRVSPLRPGVLTGPVLYPRKNVKCQHCSFLSIKVDGLLSQRSIWSSLLRGRGVRSRKSSMSES